MHRASRRHSKQFLSLPLRQLNPINPTTVRIMMRNKRDHKSDIEGSERRRWNRKSLKIRHFSRIYLYQHCRASGWTCCFKNPRYYAKWE